MKAHTPLTQRTGLGQCLSAIMALFIAISSVSGQSPSHPDSKSPLKPNQYLRHQDPWRWDITSQLILNADLIAGRYGNDNDLVYNDERRNQYTTRTWDLPNFEFIYPVVREGGFYWSPNEDIASQLRIDGIRYTPEPEVLQTPDTHAKYAWWRSNQRDEKTQELYFSQVSHIVSADTVFEEERAKQIPWPKDWPEDAARFLTPVVDRVTRPIDPDGANRIEQLVNYWTQDQDPKSIDQVTLTKFLTGKVIEYVKVTRGRTEFVQTIRPSAQNRRLTDLEGNPNVPTAVPTSTYSGFNARSADQIALDPEGSELDLATLLTAVFRQAGVPARTVICFDRTLEDEQDKRITALVEFAMFDPVSDQTLWVPVDPIRLRDSGRRSNNYEQRWLYFGTHDKLHNLVPLAYYFHPPVNYKAYGYPSLYGIKTTPDIGTNISQFLSIDVMNTPVKAEDFRQDP
ncbi:MAG: transglutaminase domain-containing protein [Phycisphaerales bacterium]|nr:transglutaminase domain-containing protein [Phycisphaerales bacterium]